MHEAALEQRADPEALIRRSQHIEHEANVDPLLYVHLLVTLDLAKHAHDAEERVLLQLSLALELASKVLLQKLVLDEREAILIEVLDQLLNQVVR